MEDIKMSDVFNKFEDAVYAFGKEATRTAKEVAGNAKNKIDVKSKEYDLKNLYADLGRLYYADHKDDADYAYSKMLDIRVAEAELEQLRNGSETVN